MWQHILCYYWRKKLIAYLADVFFKCSGCINHQLVSAGRHIRISYMYFLYNYSICFQRLRKFPWKIKLASPSGVWSALTSYHFPESCYISTCEITQTWDPEYSRLKLTPLLLDSHPHLTQTAPIEKRIRCNIMLCLKCNEVNVLFHCTNSLHLGNLWPLNVFEPLQCYESWLQLKSSCWNKSDMPCKDICSIDICKSSFNGSLTYILMAW